MKPGFYVIIEGEIAEGPFSSKSDAEFAMHSYDEMIFEVRGWKSNPQTKTNQRRKTNAKP